MTADNFNLFLGELLERKPFQAFTLILRDGMLLEVDHPQAIQVAEGIAIFRLPGSIRLCIDHDSVNFIIDAPAADVPNGPQ